MEKVGTRPLLRADSITVKSEPLIVQRRPRCHMSMSVEGTVRVGGVGALPGMQGVEARLFAKERRRWQLECAQARVGLQILTPET